jgi:hypothetical protein
MGDPGQVNLILVIHFTEYKQIPRKIFINKRSYLRWPSERVEHDFAREEECVLIVSEGLLFTIRGVFA